MKKRVYGVKELCLFAIFISLGLVLQYIESFFTVIPVPGGKIGLANIVSIVNIFMFGGGNALLITTIRAFIGAILTGGATAVPYSVGGAVVSVILMWVSKKFLYPKLSIIGISIIGAAGHNVMQLCVASILFSSGYIFSYLAPMLAVAVLGGAVTGYAAKLFMERYQGEKMTDVKSKGSLK